MPFAPYISNPPVPGHQNMTEEQTSISKSSASHLTFLQPTYQLHLEFKAVGSAFMRHLF